MINCLSQENASRLSETFEQNQQLDRRSFMIAAATSIAQPITSLAGQDSAGKTMWMALNKPCRVLPGLESQRLPEWLCRAYCHVKPHCLEHMATP